jgi:hypothetical protein
MCYVTPLQDDIRDMPFKLHSHKIKTSLFTAKEPYNKKRKMEVTALHESLTI